MSTKEEVQEPGDFSWLFGEDEDEQESGIKMPQGGVFVSGFSGQWTCVPMYRTWYDEGISLGPEPHQINAEFDHFQKLGRGSFYYWMPENEAQGIEAAKLIAGDDSKGVRRMAPRAIMRWELPVEKWTNAGSDEVKANWENDPITFDMPMSTLFFRRIQYEYHLFFLPSLVQEIALVNTALSERVYDYAGLLEDGDDVTDDYTERMIGANSGKDYKASELWIARKQIWSALGEDNAAKYTRNSGPKTDTESKLLGTILRITTSKSTPIWSLIQRVGNPVKNDDGSAGFPCRVVTGVFVNEDACVAATATTGNDESPNGKYPPMPKGWSGQNTSTQDWINWAADFVSKEYSGQSNADITDSLAERNDELVNQYAVTAAELTDWLPYLG